MIIHKQLIMFMKIWKTIIQQRKGLSIVYDDISDMESNKKLIPIATKLFLRARKLNISLVFISHSYFKVPETIRRNLTRYFTMKIPSKRELQKIASNHFSDIDFKVFIKLYKDYTKEPFHTTFPSDNPL